MNKYLELKKRQQEEFQTLPIVYAFGNEQFKKAMAKLGLTENDMDKVCSIYGCGDIMLKSDVPKLKEMSRKHSKELKDAIAGDKTGDGFIYDMFDAELSNHEYGYTQDPTDALTMLGLNLEKVYADKLLLKGFQRACREQTQWFERNNSAAV